MHGSIFQLLRRYVLHHYDFATWHRFIEAAHLTEHDFDREQVYPDEHLYRLIGVAATHAGLEPNALQEQFGEFLVPDLVFAYRKLIDPSWRTLDFLEHTERVMHDQVRRDVPGAQPPVLHAERLSPTQVRVRYISARHMGALAVGIIRGIARYFGEEHTLRVTPTSAENGQEVEILVEVLGLPAISSGEVPR